MAALVGGVGELWQGDLDLGRRAAEQLAGRADLAAAGVLVEELHYGAVAVAQRLAELRPEVLVLVGATARGRSPGTVEVTAVDRAGPAPPGAGGDAQRSVAHAVTGYVDVDLVVAVAGALGALPADTVVVDAEPATTGPDVELSGAGRAALDCAVDAVVAALAARGLLDPDGPPSGRLEDAQVLGPDGDGPPALAVQDQGAVVG